jgi:hypothetical protein
MRPADKPARAGNDTNVISVSANEAEALDRFTSGAPYLTADPQVRTYEVLASSAMTKCQCVPGLLQFSWRVLKTPRSGAAIKKGGRSRPAINPDFWPQ